MQRLLQLLLHVYCDRRQNCPSSSYSLQKLLHLYAKGFVTNELLDLHRLDELMNFVTNIFLKLVCWYLDPCINWLVTHWEPCIEMRDYHYITSPIGYWGKVSTVGWYQVLGFVLLVTVCFDNNGFLGVVTLNSPGEVLPRWFSLFVNKSPMSNLISTAFSYLVICLCYHAYCMKLNLINFTWLIN